MALKAWYKLNGALADSSGNGNAAATLVGSPASVAEGITSANCYGFDAAGKYAIINCPFPIPKKSEYSISFWIKFNSVQDATYRFPLYYLLGQMQMFTFE